MNTFDVIIVGAGIAGCSASILYAQKGLKVALIDKRNGYSNYKTMCTHTIQASAVPIIENVGILPLLKKAGAVLTHHQIWSKYGWIKRDLNDCKNLEESYGINLSRKVLDPILLEETKKYSIIKHMNDTVIENLIYDNDRISGLKVLDRKIGQYSELYAKLIIGADGTYSNLAKLARVEATIYPNNRLGYFAYFKHPSFNDMTASKMWYLDSDIAYAFINEDGVMLLGYIAEKTNAKNFKKITDDAFLSIFNKLPDSEIPVDSKRISQYYSTGIMKNIFRDKPSPGLAFIGDAGLTVDPIAGVGIGYAFQSAELLVNSTWKNLCDGTDYLSSAINYYYNYRNMMYDDFKIICNDSLANPFGKTAKFIFSNAAKDSRFANLFLDLCGRRINTREFFKIFQEMQGIHMLSEETANSSQFIKTQKLVVGSDFKNSDVHLRDN